MVQEKEVKYVAVFDAEYTAKTNEYKGIQEMIQYALLILPLQYTNNSCLLGEPIVKYTDFIKTTYNKSLSDFIVNLTGIKTENVESGKDLECAINEIISIIDQYKINSIYVWGPDYKILSYNLELIDFPREKAKSFLNRMVDISDGLSMELGSKKVLSQIKACKICKVKITGKNHNAPDDALNLVALINKNIKILREVKEGD